MVPVPVSKVPVTKVPVLGANFKFCTGTDEEMRDLGGEQARTMTPEEEEELLNYSEEEGTGSQTGGGEDEEMKDADSEEARQRAEKEAPGPARQAGGDPGADQEEESREGEESSRAEKEGGRSFDRRSRTGFERMVSKAA